MKITGNIKLVNIQMLAIDVPLAKIADQLKDTDKADRPKKVVIELQVPDDYTFLRDIPVEFVLKKKVGVKKSGTKKTKKV